MSKKIATKPSAKSSAKKLKAKDLAPNVRKTVKGGAGRKQEENDK